MYLFSTGEVEVATITSPTLNFVPGRGLRVAVSFDDEPPQVITLVPAITRRRTAIVTGKNCR